MYWYYVSFSNGKPLGGCFIQAEGPVRAAEKGSELCPDSISEMVVEASDEHMKNNVPEEARNRLIPIDELEKLFKCTTASIEVTTR